MEAPAARRSSELFGPRYPVYAGGGPEMEEVSPFRGMGAPMAGPSEFDHTTSMRTVQPARRPFYKQRWFILCQVLSLLLFIVVLLILLFPGLKSIAQHIVNVSALNVEVAEINAPQNDSFQLFMSGFVSHTGIFAATISFTEQVNVSWVVGDGPSGLIPLGHMQLDALKAKNKRATINQTTTFFIDDEVAFGNFTAAMITQPNFTWLLTSENLSVKPAGLPSTKGIKFSKPLTLNGFNSFNNQVALLDFQLPGDNILGGITFNTTTQLNNTSPFKVELGTVVFDLFFKDIFVGPGTSNNTVIAPGLNDINLIGRLLPQSAGDALALLGDLFTSYLNGEETPIVAKGNSTTQPDGSTISWLSAGISALSLNVPFKPPSTINSISAIDVGFLDLEFTPDTPWNPVASSNGVHATLQLPFGFGISVAQLANQFSIVQNNEIVGTLTSPLAQAASDIKVINSTYTTGNVNITLDNSPLVVPTDSHTVFSQFNADLTQSTQSVFLLNGSASAVADLSIGQIKLNPIKFSVPSTLQGLQGLKGHVTIGNVDVLGGVPDHLNLGIDVTINNPSNLNLKTGDLTLQLFSDNTLVGTNLLPNLSLVMGNNDLKASGTFFPSASPQGIALLNNFVSKKDSPISIKGYSGSTTIASLVQAFEAMSIDATLPGLKQDLLDSSSLTVLPTTGHDNNNVAHVSVKLINPFTADLDITSVQASVKSHGIPLGTIQQNTDFKAAGKATTASPPLDLNMNLEPSNVYTLLRALAVMAGERTDQLDAIVALGGIQYVQATNDDSGPTSKRDAAEFKGFDLPTFVNTAFKQLRVDVDLNSNVLIGQYQTSLSYTQLSVPTITDDTLDLLLPILAVPVVQPLVSGSNLGIASVIISDVAEGSFTATLSGSITNAGPFDAEIEFPSGLTITWNGSPLGTIAMDKVQLTGDVGAQLQSSSKFTVADVGHLTDFTKVLLTEESFEWVISGENLTVSALGIKVPGISLPAKNVTLKGMNGLKNGIIVNSFDLPSDDPAGGIHLTLQTTVTNPSQVGIQLDSIGFNNFFRSTFLGEVFASQSFTLAPQSTSSLPLAGRLVPQESPTGLSDMSTMFTDVLHSQSIPVTVVGASAGPAQVTWLNDAIKNLQISATLPAQKQFDIIDSILLNDLSLVMTESGQAFSPLASSQNTVAKYKNPFGFSLQVTNAAQDLTLSFNGNAVTKLSLPSTAVNAGVSTGNLADLVITFENQPLVSLNNDAFTSFFAQVTDKSSATVHINGSANVIAKTPIGSVSISDIAFSVDSTLTGMNSFGGTTSLSDVKITGSGGDGGNQFIIGSLTNSLTNPSGISLQTVGIDLPVIYQGVPIGRTVINQFNLKPGDSSFAAEFHYQPANPNDTIAQSFLTRFLETTDDIPLSIHGDANSSPFASLEPALEGVQLQASLKGIGAAITKQINVIISASSLITGLVWINFDIENPLDADLTIEFIQGDGGEHGEIFAHFEHHFSNFVIPPHQTVNSGTFGGVVLTQGVVAALAIVPDGIQDIAIAQTGRIGPNGYEIPWLQYQQKGVPTSYNIVVLDPTETA